MMDKLIIKNIVAGIFILGFFACKEPSPVQVTTALSDNYHFVRDSIKSKFGEGCALADSQMNHCLIISEYFLKMTGGDTVISQAINDTLDQYFKNTLVSIASYSEDSIHSTYRMLSRDELYKKIAAEHKAQTNEIPEFSGVWTIDTYADTAGILPKVISIRYSESTYLGGAHPNTFTTLLNFDTKTGKTIHFKDIVKDDKKFLKLAEEEFRTYQGLKPDQKLDEEGYFFDHGVYSLPLNFSITRAGLELFYNPYEVAAYVYGPLVYILPYERLEDCVHLEKIR